MNIDINPHFLITLEEGIKNTPPNKMFVAVHVSSWHMSVFCEYYDELNQLVKNKGGELIDPMCYSRIVLVYDIGDNILVYYDNIGLTSEAFNYWNNHKDDPKPSPIEPDQLDPVSPLTEEQLLDIATKSSKNSFKKKKTIVD